MILPFPAFPGTGEYFSSGNDLSNAIDPPEGETPLNYSAFVTALIDHKKVRGGKPLSERVNDVWLSAYSVMGGWIGWTDVSMHTVLLFSVISSFS